MGPSPYAGALLETQLESIPRAQGRKGIRRSCSLVQIGFVNVCVARRENSVF